MVGAGRRQQPYNSIDVRETGATGCKRTYRNRVFAHGAIMQHGLLRDAASHSQSCNALKLLPCVTVRAVHLINESMQSGGRRKTNLKMNYVKRETGAKDGGRYGHTTYHAQLSGATSRTSDSQQLGHQCCVRAMDHLKKACPNPSRLMHRRHRCQRRVC